MDYDRPVHDASGRWRGTTLDPLDSGVKPNGRKTDIRWYEDFECVSNMTSEESRAAYAALLARALALPGSLIHSGKSGRLQLHGNKLINFRNCAQCGGEFTAWRYRGQSRKWPSICSDACRAERNRERNRAAYQRSANY